jgi:TldD protein
MIANDAARGIDSSIVQVSAGYSDATRRILIANSDGVFATDEQVRTIFRVSAVANGDAGMQTGYDSLGHTIGFELFEEENINELAERAVVRCKLLSSADQAVCCFTKHVVMV